MGNGLKPGQEGGAQSAGTWRFHHATRAHVLIDAADYFGAMQEAMLGAKSRIMLLGWDFDTRIRMTGGRRWWQRRTNAKYPSRFGAFVVWLARRRAQQRNGRLGVYVLRWNFGALKFLARGTMALDLIRWGWNRAIHIGLDAAHPTGASQHLKLVVLDDRVAACGGIDMASDRWDTSEHRDNDPRRRRPSGRYYGPWHDVAMMVEGDAAAALGTQARERWLWARGQVLEPCLTTGPSPWPSRLAADFRDVEIGIAHTRAAWRGRPALREVEALFCEHIAEAKHFIYIENQYFASRAVAEAIAARLAGPAPPEVVLITAARSVTWLQRLAMDAPRIRLLAALAALDHARRLRVYVPVTTAGKPIYVHAKLMIVDDNVLRIGSANLNNRSMGLDSECDLFLDARRPANTHAAPAIARLRARLLAEHCGQPPATVARQLVQGTSMAELIAGASTVNPAATKRLEVFHLRPLGRAGRALADSALLDPESAEQVLGHGARRGLFRQGGPLQAPECKAREENGKDELPSP